MKTVKFIITTLYAVLLCFGAAFVCYCNLDFFEECQSDCKKWMDQCIPDNSNPSNH